MAQSSSGARLSGPSRGPRVATGTSVWGRWEIGGTLGGGAGGNGHRNTSEYIGIHWNTSDMLNLMGFWESNRSTDATIDVIVGISALVCLVSTLSYCILPWGHGERGAKPGEDLWSWTLAAPWRRDLGATATPVVLAAPRRDGNRKQKKLRNRSGGATATSATSVRQSIDLMEVTETCSCEQSESANNEFAVSLRL